MQLPPVSSDIIDHVATATYRNMGNWTDNVALINYVAATR